VSGVLAALDDTPSASFVLTAARQIAELLGASCQAVHVRTHDSCLSQLAVELRGIQLRYTVGDVARELVHALEDPRISIAVVGLRNRVDGPRPAGHVSMAIVEVATKPVLLVPPTERVVRPLRRVLVPLEGSALSSAPIIGPLGRLTDAGAVAVALHVFDSRTTPQFWDDVAHSADCYADEFTAHWCSGPTMTEVRFRRGDAAQAILDVASEADVDLIVLGWGQNLSGGHAGVVRDVLADAAVSVLLVPQR
jgi:nucleotide-binding universal stress UspA family protein